MAAKTKKKAGRKSGSWSTKKKTPGPRASTTGKRHPKADQTNWRKKLQNNRLKFDDDAKAIYLREVSKHGLKVRAAAIAGVTIRTVNLHKRADEDFEEAAEEALGTYNDTISEEVVRRGRDGVVKALYHQGNRIFDQLYDRNQKPIMRRKSDGKVLRIEEYFTFSKKKMAELEAIFLPVYETQYSDRMLELEAKRTNPGYRDKQTIDMNHGGGVMVAPAKISAEDWIKELREDNKTRRPPPGIEDKPRDA